MTTGYPDGQTPAYQVKAGWAFPARELSVPTSVQREMHGFCDIPPARYGDRADPGFLARWPIRVIGEAIFAAEPGRGYVHTVQRIRQLAPIMLDEPITASGAFVKVEDVPRGWWLTAAFEFRKADGTLALVVEPQALMADKTRMPPPDAKKADTKKAPAAPAAEEGFQTIARKQLTPDKVLGYCAGTTNLIHTDPAYAQTFGFRAPIAAGNHLIHYMLEGVACDGVPETMDVSVRLMRPVFWDDEVTVEGRRDGGRIAALRQLKADGRVANICDVHEVGYR